MVEEEDDEDEDEDEDVEDIDDDSSNVDATAHPDMPDPIMATLILRASTGGDRADAVLRIMIVASDSS